MKRLLLLVLAVFSIVYGVQAQANCDAAVITQVKGAGTYCLGSEAMLEVIGTLNDATTWTWYSDTCGGASVGTGAKLNVTVNETIIYFVRGTGGCVGNTASCSSIEVKLDDIDPVIICSKDTVVNNEPGKCGAIVTYNVPIGKDNCPDVVTELAAGLGSGAFFPVGVTKETYTVTDATGNVDSCSFTITVKDVEPPVINVNEKETVLWPPNHKHHTIAIADYIESVSDNCGGISIEDVIIDEVGSDEPNNGTGDGNTWDDILISSDCDITQLLAERAGTGNGRVYVVTMAVMDLHGNIGTALFTVEVPHDMGNKNTTMLDSVMYVQNGCDLLFEDASASSKTQPTSREANYASVYPNPFNGSFSINFDAVVDDYVKVDLYNLMGMKVEELLQHTMVEANKSYTWTIDNASLNSNEYLLVISGNKTRQVLRLIQKR